MCVFPWGDELCRKAGSHQHWLPPRRAETSTSSLRTTCGSFVHEAGSELQVHAGQTRLRTLQLSCWPCDATAALRDSAEAGDIDKGHAPKSHGSSVRDATEVQLYPKNTRSPPRDDQRLCAFVHLAHSLGKLETSRARSLLQLRSMGRLVQCPALRPSRSPSALRRQRFISRSSSAHRKIRATRQGRRLPCAALCLLLSLWQPWVARVPPLADLPVPRGGLTVQFVEEISA